MLDFHQERVDRSRKSLFPKASALKLEKILATHDLPQKGLYKLRILYHEDFHGLEFHPYEIRKISSLKLVGGETVRYSKKYADRSSINHLLARREHCDDILMTQHGFITDTSYANVALFDGQSWYTPSSPLLRGTRRAELLQKGIINSSVIRAKDLEHFQEIRLMNSMIPWEQAPRIPMDLVVF